MQLNFDISKPIYEQIIAEIKRSLVRGDLKPGSKLPSQRELARELQINHNTVQRAYREMEGVNLVKTIRGMGTYLSENEELVIEIRKEMANTCINSFDAEMFSLGMDGEEIIDLVKKSVKKFAKWRGESNEWISYSDFRFNQEFPGG